VLGDSSKATVRESDASTNGFTVPKVTAIEGSESRNPDTEFYMWLALFDLKMNNSTNLVNMNHFLEESSARDGTQSLG
jgi:hypothetical protein